MAKTLNQILVIDLEATCWDYLPPNNEEIEIIEIGICSIDLKSATILDKRSIIVKAVKSEVSTFCTQLTSLTQAQIDNGVSFEEACYILQKEYNSKEKTWASYGDFDRIQFERQCKDREIGYPFGHTHINVKNLFAIMHRLPHEVSMDKALELIHLPLDGRLHRGVDDAYNIAKILFNLLFENKK